MTRGSISETSCQAPPCACFFGARLSNRNIIQLTFYIIWHVKYYHFSMCSIFKFFEVFFLHHIFFKILFIFNLGDQWDDRYHSQIALTSYFIFRERREGERERNINVWEKHRLVVLARPQLGTWPTTKCVLTEN